MLRVTVAVALAVAVLAAITPALAAVRIGHADATVRRQLTAVRATVADLVASDDAVRGPGARRVRTVRLPHRSAGSAGVAWVELGGGPEGHRLGWRVRGGRPRHLRAPVPVGRAGRSLVIRTAGRHRLVLALVRGPDGGTVTVRRLKVQNATSRRHARTRRGGPAGLSM